MPLHSWEVFPVLWLMYCAKNDIIVSLFDALSQVTKPICENRSEWWVGLGALIGNHLVYDT
ncbi:hypothetical protein JB92DRAFT_1955701 [Gautieria morchelliformis]|nr:hypothetical protein JB92DRAFT_1955701 [Gautieria morchelliformis]